jgi:hypothetical protein
MSVKNPIKFLDAYTKEDKDIFFGREKDTNRLYEKVNQSKVVLLYGLSGTGKTSLINCGLENKYEDGQMLFIFIRRGNDIITSIRQTISSYAGSLIHPNAKITDAIETLYYDFLKPITLIFDQFEELFISGSYDEKLNFISELEKIVKSDINIKIIFSLREEYLAHMDEFEDKIPNIYDHRHRLEKMRRKTLEEVIVNMAEKGGVPLEDETVPGMIIDNISDRKGYVELPYLQVYLDKLSRLNAKTKDNSFTKKLVEQAGELEDVLGDFLEEQIDRIASLTGDKETVNTILKKLITPEGTKRPLAAGEILPDGSIGLEKLNEILTELELSRLIKLEDGIYELSHDSLAIKIAEKRTADEIQLIEVIKFIRNAYLSFRQTNTLLDRKQLKYVKPYIEKLDLTDDEKVLLKKSRHKLKVNNFFLLASAVIVLSFILAAGYFWQYNRYLDIKKQADDYMENARYTEAKIEYNRALDVPVPWKEAARDSLVRCDYYLDLKPEYDRLLAKGNSYFDLGINNFDEAFINYNAAKDLYYNESEIDQIIRNRTEDAVAKYIDLAKLEAGEGHLDIAMAHLAKANALESSDQLIAQFSAIISNSQDKELRKASEKIKIAYEIIPDLLKLIEKAELQEPDNGKFEIIKSTIAT